jgi:hypothetical protein
LVWKKITPNPDVLWTDKKAYEVTLNNIKSFIITDLNWNILQSKDWKNAIIWKDQIFEFKDWKIVKNDNSTLIQGS